MKEEPESGIHEVVAWVVAHPECACCFLAVLNGRMIMAPFMSPLGGIKILFKARGEQGLHPVHSEALHEAIQAAYRAGQRTHRTTEVEWYHAPLVIVAEERRPISAKKAPAFQSLSNLILPRCLAQAATL